MRYEADHKQKTRKRVLQEAAKAIREEGPEQVAVAAVMARAGLTHGGFYSHFSSKSELISAAIGEMFEDARGRFARSTEGYSPVEGMIRYIDFYLSPHHRDARATGCPITALAADLARLEGPAKEAYGKGVARLTNKLLGQLTLLGQDDPETLAHSVIAELVGALSLARATPDLEQSDLILAASRGALKQRLGIGPDLKEHQS